MVTRALMRHADGRDDAGAMVMSQVTEARGRAFPVLALCWATLILEGYDIVVFGAAVPHLLRYEPWSLDLGDVGLLGSVTLLGMLFGALLAGAPADRWGRRPILVTGVSVISCGMVLCAAAPTPLTFGVGRLIVGFGAGVVLPATSAMIAEFAPVGRRNLYQGLAFGGIGAGGLLSALAAITLAGAGDFRILFLVGALPSAALIPALLRWMPEPAEFRRAAARSARRDPWRVLLGPRYARRTAVFWSTTFLSLLLLFGAYTWLPVLMVRAGYSLGTSLAFLLVLNLGVVLGSLTAPWLADRFGARKIIFASFGVASAGFAVLGQGPPIAGAYALVAVIGAGAVNAQFLVNAFIAASYPTTLRATALGAALGIGRLGGVLGPLYGSWLLTAGVPVRVGFYGFALPALLAASFSLAMPVPLPADILEVSR
jgi:AAHS family benzoate transporter-like MFS transporter